MITKPSLRQRNILFLYQICEFRRMLWNQALKYSNGRLSIGGIIKEESTLVTANLRPRYLLVKLPATCIMPFVTVLLFVIPLHEHQRKKSYIVCLCQIVLHNTALHFNLLQSSIKTYVSRLHIH